MAAASILEKKDYIQVLKDPLLEASFSWYPLLVRVGERVKFVDESVGNPSSWSWEFPDTRGQKERNPTVAFGKPGKKTVTLTIEREGKTHSAQLQLDVLPLPPDAGFTAEPNVLEIGQVVHLKTSRHESGWTHKWFIGGDTQLEGPEAEWKADKTGRIEVMHSVDGPGGLVDKPFTIFVKEKPPILVARFRWSPKEVHVGEEVTFFEESGTPKKWIWEILGIGTKVEHNPSVTFSQPGKVTVKLTVERDGDRAVSPTLDLEVLPAIFQARFEAEPIKGRAPLTVKFTDKSDGKPSLWQWEFGDGKSSDRQNPSHTYEEVGRYTPRLTIENPRYGKAKDSGKITITATPPPPVWLKVLIGLIALFLCWVIIIVPLILRPLLAPHKGVAFRGTTVSHLRTIAKKGMSNFFWPCRSVTIGSGKYGDIKVGGVGQKNEYLARVSRVPTTSNYELVALQVNAVFEVRKQEVPDGQETSQVVAIAPGKPRLLRDGEQFEVRGTVLTWVQPSTKKH